MADHRVQITVDAVDKASGKLADIAAYAQKFNKDITDASVSASKSFAIGLTGALTAAAGGMAYFVNEAREAIKNENQLNAVLKSTGGVAGVTRDQVLKLSSEMQKLTNYSDDEVTSAQNLLLTFTNIKDNVFPDTTKTVLDMSAALGQDLKSSSIQLGKALNNPIDGITALSRVGVNFTDTQKEMITKMVEAGDVMGAQKLILKELNTEFGGSAQAVRDPMIQLKNTLSDTAETIGRELLPIVNDLAARINEFVQNNLDGWIRSAKEIVAWLKNHTEVIYAVAGAIIVALLPALISLIATFGVFMLTISPFIITGALIGLTVKALHDQFGSFQGFMDAFIKAWTEIGQNFKDAIVGPIDAIIAKLKELIDWVNQSVKAMLNFNPISAVGGKIGGMLGFATGGIVPGPLGAAQLAVVHGGERIVPSAGMSAGGGIGVVVNVTGNTISSDLDMMDLAERVGNELMRKLKMNIKI